MKPTLLIAVLLLSTAVPAARVAAIQADSASSLDFRALEMKILDSGGKQVGTTRFTVTRDGVTAYVKGESKYSDGERDSETELLTLGDADTSATLDSYEHRFFDGSGALVMLDRLDAKSGIASCTSYSAGKATTRSSKLEVPADSFAGASGLMMLVANFRRGNREISFHAFACVPGPAIFSVNASLPDRLESWPFHPGNLARVDMRPNLGALNLLLAPFMPTMDAWFDPDDNWGYVGGEFDRYFRGPHVLAVRVSPDK